jgi:hypothetical protein
VACIVAIPLAGARHLFHWAAILTGVVLPWAALYTTERAANFDIYLPLWLARHNQTVFGTLFVAGELLVLLDLLESLH